MNQNSHIDLDVIEPAVPLDVGTEFKTYLDSRNDCRKTDPCDSNATSDLNEEERRNATSENGNNKDLLADNQRKTSYTSTSIPCANTDSQVDDHAKSFNELRAIFSQGITNIESRRPNSPVLQIINRDARPISPGLDLTPVKEKPNVKCNENTSQKDLYKVDDLLRSGLDNSNLVKSSQAKQSVSFEIDLEDCVTRDCVTRDVLYNPPSSDNVNKLNDMNTNSGQIIKEDQQDATNASDGRDMSKKSFSWDISFDDGNIGNKSSPQRAPNKRLNAKLERSEYRKEYQKSPENNTVSPKPKQCKSNSDLTWSSTNVLPPLSFDIDSEDNMRFHGKNSRPLLSRKSQIKKGESTKSNSIHERDSNNLPEKDSKPTPGSVSRKSASSPAINQVCHGLSDNAVSKRDISPYHALDAFPEKEQSGDPPNVTTSGISFDISFGEVSPLRKTKLTPKHIRLKMQKAKAQKETNAPKKATVNVSSIRDKKSVLSFETDVKRDTYTLDEVSQTLQEACEKGQTLEQALDDLSHSHDHLHNSNNKTGIESSDTIISKRGTYSLDDVSNCLIDAANNGLTVTQALDALEHSEKNVQCIDNKEDNTKRGTYDLNDVSAKIDSKKNQGNTLEQALEQLLNEVETSVRKPLTNSAVRRGTYDLEDVSTAVDSFGERGLPVEDSLNKISCVDASDKSYIQERVSRNKVNRPCEPYIDKDKSLEKRGTYSLDDISDQLDSADHSTTVIDTLHDISNNELNVADRKTYTLDEVAQSLELAKTKGIPIVQALNSISDQDDLSAPGSRGTYSLDEVAESLESARAKGLPIVMTLENLVSQGGCNLRTPSEVAIHRRQGKLTNRKTYALASPLETIGEDNQLRLFDGTSRKLLPTIEKPNCDTRCQNLKDEDRAEAPNGTHVMQTLDLLTSACEALLKSPPRQPNSEYQDQDEINSEVKKESCDRGTYSLEDVSENLKSAEEKGIPVVEALQSLTTSTPAPPTKHYRIPRALRKGASKSESNVHTTNTREVSSRQTYSLDNVSNSVAAAEAQGIPVIAALDELTESLARFSATGAKAIKTGKKPIKKPDRPSIRKREAARLERSGVRSEAILEMERSTSNVFPISYPPAMRNSYSLDDVATAFEMAYKTGVSFQDVLDGKTGAGYSMAETNSSSTGSLKADRQAPTSHEQKCHYVKSDPTVSLPKNVDSSGSSIKSSSDSQLLPHQRQDSRYSEGSLSSSSSAGSEKSLTKDSPSKDKYAGTQGKPRKRDNGPFQLQRTRKRSPANLGKPNVSLASSKETSLRCEGKVETVTPIANRGTYDLKKVSEQLDDLKDRGVGVAKSLDMVATSKTGSGTPEDVCHSKRGTYNFEDLSPQLGDEERRDHSIPRARGSYTIENVIKGLSDIKYIPDLNPQVQPQVSANTLETKRATYNLEDSEFGTADHTLSYGQSNKNVSDTGNRLDDTTCDKRSVPLDSVIDELSNIEPPKEQAKRSKTKYKPFTKPQARQKMPKDFFIDFFSSQTEEKPSRFIVENGEALELSKSNIDNKEKKSLPEMIPDESKVTNANTGCRNSDSHFIAPKTFDNPDSETTFLTIGKEDSLVSVTEATKHHWEIEGESSVNLDQSTLANSQPRWQRTGSYVEALNSFEDMLDNQDTSTIPLTSNDNMKAIHENDSNGEGKASETTLPGGTSRGRSTWRPSGSVLGQILSLMDDAEEKGLSIADALEQAAEMSEKEGEIEESKNDDLEQDTSNPHHLALLSLHFEEKRRQIEAERHRNQEQWEEERRKIGETTFWYTIGRAHDKDHGINRPGLEKPAEQLSPGQPTPPIGSSTPFESRSPLQGKSVYHSPAADGQQTTPRSQAQTAIGHGFIPASIHRPGHQTSPQSSAVSQTGFQFPLPGSPTCQMAGSNQYSSSQHNDCGTPPNHAGSHHSPSGNLHNHSGSPHTYGGSPHNHGGSPHNQNSPNGHQYSYPSEHNPCPSEQEYETRQILLSEYAVQSDNMHERKATTQSEPTKSPVRRCWEVTPPSPKAVFSASPYEGEALPVEGGVGEQYDNHIDDSSDVHNKKGVAMFIGDEAEKPKDGLTAEQQRKRDRFLKSRQKKQEEEKVRRDAENEKKRLRELKQREVDEQKRLEEEQKRDELQRRVKHSRDSTTHGHGGELTYRQTTNTHEDNSAFTEFSGPRCYVKPSGKSNRKLITNAISHVCLSGTVNKENKEKCLQAIADSPGFHFIVLFKDGLKFRGLYMLNPENEQAFKVFGIGPKMITSKMVDCVYKYSSGGKEFTKIPSKTLSISVDGVAILKTYWQSNKPHVASKTQSNLKRPPRPPQR